MFKTVTRWMRSFKQRLAPGDSRPPGRPSARTWARPQLEPLEARELLSGNNQLFLTGVHREVLQREIDSQTLATLGTRLDSGAARSTVLQSLFSSTSYRTQLVQEAYNTWLGRPADPVGLRQSVLYLATHSVEQLEAGLIASREFLLRRTNGTTGSLLRTIYRTSLGRDPEPAALALWGGQLGRHGLVRLEDVPRIPAATQRVALQILTSPERQSRQIRQVYEVYLGRPATAPVVQAWVGLYQRTKRFEPVLAGILGSVEYLQRRVAPVQVATVSPANGNEMVSLTRETVVTFSREINPATITPETFYVTAKGSRIPGTIRVSSNKRSATLFYTDSLPEATAVRVVVDGNNIKDLDGRAIDADRDGLLGGMGTADFRTLPLTLIPGTRLFGYVYDSYNKNPDGTDIPVVGATISLDANPAIRAVTDANGFFELGLAGGLPAPEFFVHIDGSTALNAPAGSKYATLGKPFHSVPGQRVQLRMDGSPVDVDPTTPGEQFHIYLPPMAMADIVPLPTNQTKNVGFGPSVLSNPARMAELFPKLTPAQRALLSLTQVTYPPGSAKNADGTPATLATVIPVNPERLPAPLPGGVDPKLVISIQAGTQVGGVPQFNQAGGSTNFDVPAPVQFPNLDGLRPGEKSLLWSFDHDAGMWVVIGTGTVTPDGRAIASDPGVGVLAPGWHFANPGTKAEQPKKPENPDCKPFKQEDIYDDIWTVGKAIFDCTRNIFSVLKVLGTILDQVDAIKVMTQNALKLAEDLKAGKSLAAAADAFGIIEALKDKTVSLYEAASATNPVSKAVAVAQCAANLANTIAGRLCTDSRKACYSAAGAFLCDRIPPMLEFANKMVSKASDLDKSIREAPLVAFCLALNGVKNILATAGSGSIARSSEFELLGSARADAIAKLAEVVQLGRQFDSVFAPSRDSVTVMNGGLALVEQARLNGLTPLVRNFRTMPNAYWRFSAGAFSTTGRFNRVGEADFPVIAALSRYHLQIYDPVQNVIAETRGTAAQSGFQTIVSPVIVTELTDALDTDGDGLADIAESIVGTAINNADSDGDGVLDGAELAQGLNPLDNIGFPTGLISSLPLPGAAQALAVANNTVYVATGNHGLAIIDGTDFDNPIVLGQLDLSGNATDVSVDPARSLAAVATGLAVQVVDIADPLAPVLVRTVSVSASAVEVLDGFAYTVGGTTLSVVDLSNGDIVRRLTLPGSGSVTGFAREGNRLYALVSGGTDTLVVIGIARADQPTVLGSRLLSIASGDVGLFVGNDTVWLAGSGLRAIDASNPANLQIVGQPQVGGDSFSARRLTLNGSGLALVTPDGGGPLALYNVSDRTRTGADRLLTNFNISSGSIRDVAVSRGIGYVAVGNRLNVVNYQPFDSQGQAPTNVSLTALAADLDPNTAGIQVLEGTRVALRLAAQDDVQVRQVEFLVNGQVFQTDVAFPFDPVVTVPLIANVGSTLTLTARVTDTGGNSTLSAPVVLQVVPDTTPPLIESTSPVEAALVREGRRTLRVRFSEPVDSERLSAPGAVRLINAGPDGNIGTADDQAVPVILELRDNARLLQIAAANLVPGQHQLRIARSAIVDAAGNPAGTGDAITNFTVGQSSPRLVGNPPTIAFVLDISNSAMNPLGTSGIGDRNGDGTLDSILDAEIAGYEVLNQELINRGLGNTARVLVVPFAGTATARDMDPVMPGVQLFTTPLADVNNNGIRDVVEVLQTLRVTDDTNFEVAYQAVLSAFSQIGVTNGTGNVIFLTDGTPTAGSFNDEVATLTSQGHGIVAFGAGTNANLTFLQQMDPLAARFSTTDELLDLFLQITGS